MPDNAAIATMVEGIEVVDGFVQVGAGLADLTRKTVDTADTAEIIDLVRQHGASRAVVTPAEWGPSMVDPTFEQGNTDVAALAAADDTLYGLGRINARFGPAAVAETERCLGELGMVGVVLRPGTDGYYLADEHLVDPVMNAVAGTGKYVVFHLDFIHSPNCMPIHVLRTAENHPDVPIVLSQIGMRTHADACLVAKRADNVYLMTPGMGSLQVRNAVREFGLDRLIYASDAPIAGPDYEVWRMSQAETATRDTMIRVLGGTLRDLISAGA